MNNTYINITLKELLDYNLSKHKPYTESEKHEIFMTYG